jgi:hypothetical protein
MPKVAAKHPNNEMSVARMAVTALRNARREALQSGIAFMEVRDGNLVEVLPSGEVRFIREIAPGRVSDATVPAEHG